MALICKPAGDDLRTTRRTFALTVLASGVSDSIARAQILRAESESPTPPPLGVLRVIAFAGGWNLPLWVAERQGLFARQGVAAELAYTPNSGALVGRLMGGQSDIALASIDNLVAYQEGQGDGAPLASPDLVAVMGVDNGFLSVVAQQPFRSLADLRGKRLAVDSLNTGFAFVLRELLRREGIDEADVTFVRGGATDLRFQGLIAGNYDATLLRTPFDLLAAERGCNTLATAEALGPYLGTSGFVRRSWATSHPTALVAFLRAYRAAMQWLADPANRETAEALLRDNIRDMTPELARRAAATLLASPGGLLRDLEIDEAALRTVLDLRSRYGQPSRDLREPGRYVDLAYRTKALAAP